jgi:hypothetical protein
MRRENQAVVSDSEEICLTPMLGDGQDAIL